MELINNPQREQRKELLKRPYVDNRSVLESVQQILNGVRQHGDEALRSFTKKFDGVDLADLEVSREEIESASAQLSPALKNALQQAKSNLERFHYAQVIDEEVIETMPGILCWRRHSAIERVGLYIPGGTAPLFSTVLMLGVPAQIAGCSEIILCTPADKNGMVHPAVLYAASLVGVTRIFKAGGAQAIAAMAYGTQSIHAVHKIFGPGNQYVTAAKQLVQMNGTAIDMPAGPSEVCLLVDHTAAPSYVAADLLAQAEHGADSQVLLVSWDLDSVNEVMNEIELQIARLPRMELSRKALSNSRAVVVSGRNEAIELVNEYAAEHLIIICEDADAIANRVINAGSVFIGPFSPESAGDYASGTNHTLPTNGFAKAYSGVSVDSFVKKITYQKLTKEGLEGIAQTVIEMAEAEGLQAHAQSVRVRIEPDLKKT